MLIEDATESYGQSQAIEIGQILSGTCQDTPIPHCRMPWHLHDLVFAKNVLPTEISLFS